MSFIRHQEGVEVVAGDVSIESGSANAEIKCWKAGGLFPDLGDEWHHFPFIGREDQCEVGLDDTIVCIVPLAERLYARVIVRR